MSQNVNQSGENPVRKPVPLTGRHSRQLDPKKRITVPSSWRDTLGPERVYVMPDISQPCLQLVPIDLMEAKVDEWMQMSLSDDELNAKLDALGTNSEVVDFDVQGRIRIPDRMLDLFGISGAVELRGSIRRATIWPAAPGPDKKPVDLEAFRAAMKEVRL